MTIDRDHLFTTIRPMFTGMRMNQSQVDGTNAILDAWEKWEPAHADLVPNIRWLAYALATTFHETARTMQPIAEYGQGKGRDYGIPDPVTHQVYYGRGLVMLTWKPNYQVQSARLGVDMVNNPELAMRPDLAADILLTGMATGAFTGRRLGQYFGADPAKDDPVNARRIVNSLDCATSISQYHRVMLRGLTAPAVIVPRPVLTQATTET